MTPKKILTFALGPIGAATLGLITIPLLTGFFSSDDIGRIAMLQIAVTFCLLFMGLGLDQAYVREYYEEKNKPELLLNTLLPGLIFLLLSLLPFLIFPQKLSLILFDMDSHAVGIITIIALIGSFASRFLSVLLRLQERGVAFSLNSLLPKLIFMAAIIIYITFNLEADFFKLIISHVISIIFALLILLINTKTEWEKSIRQKIVPERIKGMLSFSLPLVLSGTAYWGLTTVDRILLRNFSSFHEMGIYSIAASFSSLATIFQGIFGLIWSPWIYKTLAEGRINIELIAKAQRKVALLVVLLFCATGAFSWLIDFILPLTYKEVKYIVVACIGLPIFYTLSEATGVGIGIRKKSMLFMWATFISLLISLALNYILIPIYGASGAAVSTCIALWFFFFLKTEISNKIWQKFSRIDIYLLPTTCLINASLMALKIVSQEYIMIIWTVIFATTIFFYKKDALEIIQHIESVIKHRTKEKF